ncbi:MAG: hypothetical protein SWN10_01505 [Pseudomonadota bacterium]|nr:hypothetical protein [Pseudomonadota bacterium]
MEINETRSKINETRKKINARLGVVTPEIEQQYLAYTGKISVAAAVLLLMSVAQEFLGDKGSVMYWVLGCTMLSGVILVLLLSIKSIKFYRYTNRLGFWSLKFQDEYADYVSASSLRITCHIMMFGGFQLAILGDSQWFLEFLMPVGLTDALLALLGVAMLTHGVLILWKLREEDAGE